MKFSSNYELMQMDLKVEVATSVMSRVTNILNFFSAKSSLSEKR